MPIDQFNSVLSVVQVIFIVFDALFFGIFVFAFSRSIGFRPKLHPSHKPVRRTFTLRDQVLRERWDNMMRRSTLSPDSMRLAVVEADKIVDDALKQMNLTGDSMADRLKQLHPEEIKSLDKVWRAHRVRNMIVHTPGFELLTGDAEHTLEDYEEFLKEVKILK